MFVPLLVPDTLDYRSASTIKKYTNLPYHVLPRTTTCTAGSVKSCWNELARQSLEQISPSMLWHRRVQLRPLQKCCTREIFWRWTSLPMTSFPTLVLTNQTVHIMALFNSFITHKYAWKNALHLLRTPLHGLVRTLKHNEVNEPTKHKVPTSNFMGSNVCSLCVERKSFYNHDIHFLKWTIVTEKLPPKKFQNAFRNRGATGPPRAWSWHRVCASWIHNPPHCTTTGCFDVNAKNTEFYHDHHDWKNDRIFLSKGLLEPRCEEIPNCLVAAQFRCKPEKQSTPLYVNGPNRGPKTAGTKLRYEHCVFVERRCGGSDVTLLVGWGSEHEGNPGSLTCSTRVVLNRLEDWPFSYFRKVGSGMPLKRISDNDQPLHARGTCSTEPCAGRWVMVVYFKDGVPKPNVGKMVDENEEFGGRTHKLNPLTSRPLSPPGPRFDRTLLA